MKKTKVGKFAGTLRVEKELDTLDIKLVSKIQKGFMEYTSEVDVLNLISISFPFILYNIINEIEKVEACNKCFHTWAKDELKLSGNFSHLFWLVVLALRGDYTEEELIKGNKDLFKELSR